MSKNSDKILKSPHYITSSFGLRIDPITKNKTFHYGTDYGMNGVSIPTYAPTNGTVYRTGYDRSCGYYVIIKYVINGTTYYSRSQHLTSSNIVGVGQQIDNNTIIGYTGTTGSSTGIHLDFRWYIGGYGDSYAVDFEKTIIPTQIDTIKNGVVISEVNVREGPGLKYGFTNYQGKHELSVGTKVKWQYEQNGWFGIFYGDHGGWVAGNKIKRL